MKRTLNVILLCFCLLNPTLAAIPDSTIYSALHRLADQLHLKKPNSRKGEYEIRIWQKVQLVFGDAHVVYVLNKKAENIKLVKYQIHSDKRGFQNFTKLKPVHLVDSTSWSRLVQADILTLPDWSTVEKQFHAGAKKDTTIVTVASDGNSTVKANKTEPRFIVGDGETYYFEVFSKDGHRAYSYDNPTSFARIQPLPELQKVVFILDELSAAFEYRQ